MKELDELTDYYLNNIEKNGISELDFDDIGKVYKDLIEIIRYHNNLYYIKASPVISDYQYDQLFDLLKHIEKKYPDIISEDSPTQRLVGQIQSEFKSANHKVPLLSLDNSYNTKDLYDWADFVKKNLDKNDIEKFSYFVDPKFDGASVELVYNKGKLKQAITRGDGYVGEDITENVKTMQSSVPLNIDSKEDELRLRGEIVMPKTSFEKLNEQRQKEGVTTFANPRNAAAGTLKQLDSSMSYKRGLVCFVYDMLYYEGDGDFKSIYTFDELINHLKKLGFLVFDWYKVYDNIDEVINLCNDSNLKNWLEEQNFEFDGLVIKINQLNLCNMLGSTAHHPRRSMAFKFPAKQVVTQIKDIELNVSRTGAVNPSAILDPVDLSGVTIRKATLHNYDFIKEKDIKKGDYVWIQRSGEVIPYIISSIPDRRDENVEDIYPPNKCPICGSDIIKIPEDINYYCSNISCPAVIKEHLVHFTSKECMDIEGLGEKFIDLLVDRGLLTRISDVYKLGNPDVKVILTSLPLMGDKRVSELLGEIENSKSIYLNKLINSLGIKFIGKKTSRVLEYEILKNISNEEKEKFDNQKLIYFLTNHEFLTNIHGIGPKIVHSLEKYLGKEENIKIINELYDYGVKFNIFEYSSTSEKKLSDISFSITGKFDLSREEIISILEQYGAEFHENPTKNTSFLLCGDSPGSKINKAKNNGVKILNGLNELLDSYAFLKKTINEYKDKNDKPKMQSLF